MTQTSARKTTINLVKANGWTLATDATTHVGSGYSKDLKQDPFTFVKDAAQGGQWRLHLNYINHSGWNARFDNTLREATLTYIPAEGLPEDETWHQRGKRIQVLKNSDRSRYSSTSWLWEALGLDTDGETFYDKKGEPRTLRQRAELLVANPELAVWIAKELEYEQDERLLAASKAREAEAQARAQALPITCTQNGYDSEWADLARDLKRASGAVAGADGKSDLPTLVANLKAAVAAIEAVMA